MTRGEQDPRGPLDIHWSDRARDDLAAIGNHIAAAPGCEGSCSGDVLDCSTTELDKLRECAQVLEGACSPPSVAQAAWSACLVQVSCYTD